MAKPKIGVQLIVYGGRQTTDLAGVLSEVAQAGYAGVEAGNLFDSTPPDEVKRLYKDYGLVVTGVHGGYGEVSDPAKLEHNMDFLKQMNARYLICSGVAPGEGMTAYETAAKTFNQVGETCRKAGLVFCYHNHNWEFKEFDGVKAIHRLAELTDPELVKLCIDVYWVTIGGENPAEFIRRYRDRAPYMHFKDGAPGQFIELGRGTVDLIASTQATLEVGAEWIVCEQDRSDQDPGLSIAESRRYIKEKLGL